MISWGGFGVLNRSGAPFSWVLWWLQLTAIAGGGCRKKGTFAVGTDAPQKAQSFRGNFLIPVWCTVGTALVRSRPRDLSSHKGGDRVSCAASLSSCRGKDMPSPNRQEEKKQTTPLNSCARCKEAYRRFTAGKTMLFFSTCRCGDKILTT